jgi:uncharacterized protein (TIGR02757 family)
MEFNKKKLESIYKEYNLSKLVSPDPLQFLYSYPKPEDREIIALIAAGLAYGRVAQILKSVQKIIDVMGDSPADFIRENSECEFRRCFNGFKHRFTTGEDFALFLAGVKAVLDEFGSLAACFYSYYTDKDENIIPALTAFAGHLTAKYDNGMSYLFPSPLKGSACKRPMLFLRWMVRADDVDPGGWNHISPSKLIIPLDTHMHQFALKAGFTTRKNANLATAIEITEGFKKICPKDPIKYDFAITRFGIRDDMHVEQLHSC